MCETFEYSTEAPYYVPQNNGTTIDYNTTNDYNSYNDIPSKYGTEAPYYVPQNNNTTNNYNSTNDYNSYKIPDKNSTFINTPSISNSYNSISSSPNSYNQMPSTFNDFNNTNRIQLYEIFNAVDIFNDKIPNTAAIRNKDFIHGSYSDYYTNNKSVDAVIRYWKTGNYFDMLINQIGFSKYKCTIRCDGNDYFFYANGYGKTLEFENSAQNYLIQCMNSEKELKLYMEEMNSLNLKTYLFNIDTSGFRELFYKLTSN